MREWLDDAGGDRDVGIEEPRKVDAVRLGYQAQKVAVTIEGPGTAHLYKFEERLVVAVRRSARQVTIRVAEDDLEALLADPLGGLDGGGA